MLANDLPRPTFLIRGVVLATGSPRCDSARLPRQVSQFKLPSGNNVEALWAALEPLILALTLGGYEVPEILVAAPGSTGTAGYLTLSCQYGTVAYAAGDWRLVTGAAPTAEAGLAISLHVTVRRTLGVASKHPPIGLQGVGGYIARRDLADKLSDPRDGWLNLFSSPWGFLTGQADTIAQRNMPGAMTSREAVVAALSRAWRNDSQFGAVGLLWYLDPEWWESALDRNAPVWPFDWMCTELWSWLLQSDVMDGFLARAPTDREASFGRLVELSGAEQAMIDYDPTRFGSTRPLKRAQLALKARGLLFHKTDANLPLVLGRLEKTHYALALFVLHEYGLIRMLPFPLEHAVGIPLVDLTGWYETVGQVEPSGAPFIATVQLNQAGDRIVGWMYDDQLVRWDLAAELDITSYDPERPDAFSASTFNFNATRTRAGAATAGSIYLVPAEDRWQQDFKVSVAFGSNYYALIRLDRNARVSPATLRSAIGPAAPADLGAQTAPLHTLSKAGIGHAISFLVDRIESITQTSADVWDTGLGTAFSGLRRLLENESVLEFDGTNAKPSPMLARFRIEVANALLRTPIQAAAGTDGWTHLLGMFAETGDDSLALQQLIGAGPSRPHAYVFQMGGIGVGGVAAVGGKVELGAFIVGCGITHKPDCAPPRVDKATHGWFGFYSGRLVQGGVGLELGGEIDFNFAMLGSPNDLQSSSNWAPEDFAPSLFTSMEIAAESAWYAGVGLQGVAPQPSPWGVLFPQGEGYLFINRHGAFGYGTSSGWSVKAGFGAGVGISASIGPTVALLTTKWTNTQATLPTAPPPVTLIATVSKEVEEGFGVESAELVAQTKAHLLRFIAEYRALFESPTSSIVIEGDASRTGLEPFNESLSWRRALAVCAFVRTALSAPPSDQWVAESNALAVPDGRIKLVANGETQPRLAGVADGVETAQWRRVKVVINDQVLTIV